MARVIGIMSLKGGAGKTSVTASLGKALAELKKKVLLIDCNFNAPNLGIHFNLIEPETTIHDVLGRKANISNSIYAVGDLDVIPARILSNKISALKFKNIISPVKRKYDFIVLDSAPSLEEDGLAVLYASDEVFFVATPDYSTLSNTIKLINRTKERGVNIRGIILNKVYNKNFELSLEQIEDATGIPVMAVIPHETRVLKAQSNFMPIVEYSPNSKGSREFKKLAAALSGEKLSKDNFLKRFFRISPKKQEINREVLYERVFKE